MDDCGAASHLDCCLLVIFVLGQAVSPQHKIALVPVLDQTPLLFLEPAGLQRPLHGPGGAHGAGAGVPLSRHHTPGPGWNATKLRLVKMSRKRSISKAVGLLLLFTMIFFFFFFFAAELTGFLCKVRTHSSENLVCPPNKIERS